MQLFEVNSMVKVPGSGQNGLEVFGGVGGCPAAYFLLVLWRVMGGRGLLLVEHFLTKSAFRASTPSPLLASLLSKAGWSVSVTWKVRLYKDFPLLALKCTYSRLD